MALQVDDIGFVGRLKRGDQSAFREVVLHYQDRIYTLCLYMLNDARDAEEAAQDVFIKAHRALPRFEPRASLYTWLYSIATRTCLDYRRKTIRLAGHEPLSDDLPSVGVSPERHVAEEETSRVVRQALQKLPKKLKAAIVLREMEELSYTEIAEVMDVSIGTVKSRISRAREELRRLLPQKW